MATRNSSPPAIVLLSGGLDSAVTLAVARKEGFACHALSFDYGQRHRVELAAAARVAKALHAVEHRVVAVDLRAIGGSALTDDTPVPKDGGKGSGLDPSGEPRADRRHLPTTYVPGRNLVFLSIAAGYAQTIDALDLYYGANHLDSSGYPDCRMPFVGAFVDAANLACGLVDPYDRRSRRGGGARGFTVHVPLINHTKAQIIQWGRKLGVDYSLTHSCYDPTVGERGEGFACGHCDSCILRRRGFEEAGIADPTRYVAESGQVAEWHSGKVAN